MADGGGIPEGTDGDDTLETPAFWVAGAPQARSTDRAVGNDAGILLLPGRTFALTVLVEGNVGATAAPV